MRKAQVVLGIALVAILGSFANAEVSTAGVTDDANVSLVYDEASGNLSLDAGGHMVSTLEVISASGTVFTGTQPAQVEPPFDVYSPEKFFLLKTMGIGNEDFGPAAAPGLQAAFLGGDLTINGSVLPSGGLPGGGDLVYQAVPEPSAVALILMGLLGVLGIRRK